MPTHTAGTVKAKIVLDVSEFNQAINKLKKDVEKLKTGLSSVNSKQSGLEKEVSNLRNQISELVRVNETLSDSNSKIKAQNRELASDFKQVSRSIEQHKEEINLLSIENDKLTASTQRLEKENESLDISLSTVTSKLEAEKTIGDELSDEIYDLRNSVKGLKKENEGLSSEVSKVTKQLESEKAVNQDLVKDNENFVKSIEKLKKEHESLKSELNSLKESYASTSEAWHDSMRTVDLLTEENDRLRASLKKLEKEEKTAGESAETTTKSMNKLKESLSLINKSRIGISSDNFRLGSIGKGLQEFPLKVKQAVTAEKELEVQTTKTMSKLERAFTKDLFKYIDNAPIINRRTTPSVSLTPIYNELKQKYKPYINSLNQFSNLWAKSLSTIGASLRPSNRRATGVEGVPFELVGGAVKRFDLINISAIKTKEEVKKALTEIETETKKLETSTESAMNKSAKSTEKFSGEVKKLKRNLKDLTSNKQAVMPVENTGTQHSLKDLQKLSENAKKATTETKKLKEQLIQMNTPISTGAKSSLKEITNLNWEATISQLNTAGQAFNTLEKNLQKTSTNTKKSTNEIKSSFSQLEKEFTLDLYNLVKGAGKGDLSLSDVLNKMRMKYLSFISDLDDFKTKFARAVRTIGASLGRNSQWGRMVSFPNTDYGFNLINANNLKGLREIKSLLDGVTQEQVVIPESMEAIASSTNQAELAVTSFKKQLKELASALKSYNQEHNRFYMKGFGKELDLTETAELNEKYSLNRFLKEFADAEIKVKRSSEEIENAIRKFASINYSSQETRLQEYLNYWAEAPITVKRSVDEINNAISKFAQFNWKQSNKRVLQDFLKEFAEAPIVVNRSVEEINSAISKFAQMEYELGKVTNDYLPWIKMEEGMQGLVGRFTWLNEQIPTTLEYLGLLGKEFKLVSIAQEQFTQSLMSNSNGVDIAKRKLAEYAEQTKATFETMQVELAKANSAQYKYWKQVRGSANVEGWNVQPLQISGYNEYLQQIESIRLYNAEIERNIALEKERRSLLAKKDNIAYSTENLRKSREGLQALDRTLTGYYGHQKEFTGYNEKTVSSLTKLNRGLNKSVYETDTLSRGMKYVNQDSLRAKYGVDTFGRGVKVVGDYTRVTKDDLAKMKDNLTNTGNGMNSLNKGMQNTAHSGRILSNTLYQIRGALLSLKMIFTAMGGMMVWGFAMEIAEGIKTTFTAKNELEAQLKQNTKVGESGINRFNQALDQTISKFQKINKYHLGETVSSLGVEFELTSRQMEKAMPIVAMVQSEYIRAGRTSEEASLAVKDILQGEFQRLSRETGVGKEDLLAYGWSGDKTDIDSLLDAVKKAGEARHWDIFAKKATSLNDVIEITKSRFEEFGADILQSISPMVVSGFNTMVDVIEGLQKSFNSLGSFSQNLLVGGSFISGVLAIGTALPMVAKGMGLADIATIGWGKSILTTALNLNKATVAQYGFKKALAEVVTGTKASELANVRTTKALMGRVLGVKQSVLAEHGYMTALVQSRGVLMNHTGATNIAKISSMGLAQKVAYLTNNMTLQDAQALKTSTAIRKIATSWRLVQTAMLGVMAIGIISWYSSMATWADTVKKNIDSLNKVIDDGDEMLDDAKKKASNYEEALGKLTEGTNEYAKAENNLKVANYTALDIEKANKLAKIYKEHNKKAEQDIANRHKKQMSLSYQLAGIDTTKADEMASGWYLKVKAGEQNWIDSMNIYNDRLYKSNQHINEHLKYMDMSAEHEKDRIKYIQEYSAKAEEVADYWKKFNQGDMTSGAYAVLGEFQLLWIDLWNDQHFISFWDSVKKTWKDIKPTIDGITKSLGDLGHFLLDIFATKEGQIVGGIAIMGTALGAVGIKFYHILGGAKSTWDIMKGLGGTLKDRIKDWKGLGTEAEKATEKMGGSKSTGGITGGKASDKVPKLGEQLKSDARNYVRAGVAIFAGMMLITEAIYLLQAPMLALSETGKTFKAKEPSIREGIEGLKLIAPTVIAILIPVMALMKVMDLWGKQIMNIKTLGATAMGIAVGLLLVTEAIIMLKAPMWALAQLGNDYVGGKSDIQGGITAMKVMGESLTYLAPFVPVFLAGIALMAVTITAPEIGLPILGATVAGIAVGMLLVAEAVVTLRIPLEAIRELGNSFTDIEGAKKGAEVLKTTAIAMGYIDVALSDLVEIQWEDIKSRAMSLTGISLDTSLNDLVKEGGFFTQLNTFMTNLNSLEIVAPLPEKVEALNAVADGIGAIDEAIKNVKSAMENLPNEFKNGGNGTPALSYDMNSGTTSVTGSATDDPSGYFEQFKAPLKELKTFIDDFNNSDDFDFQPPDTGRIEAISQSADMVTQINEAVTKVKDVMGNIAWGNVNTNFAQTTGFGGGLGSLAVLNPLASLGVGIASDSGSGDYQSSLGSQLHEMELVINDLNTFNSNISGISSGSSDGGNAQALSETVTIVSDAITKLNDTLAQAVPNIKQNATNIGSGIKEGIKTGMGDLSGIIVTPLVAELQSAKANAGTYGKGTGWSFTNGLQTELKIKSTTETEISSTLTYLDGKKQEFYDKGYALGDSLSKGYKDGQDMHSPGIIARSTKEELDRVTGYFDEAIINLPQMAFNLGNTLSSNFNLDFGLGGLQLPSLDTFQQGLQTIVPMVDGVKTQVSTSFDTMKTNIGLSLSNVALNATSKYQQMVNSTRTSMANMQNTTTSHIGQIKSSWRGMQSALIASAENIRNETTTKINTIKSNMADFWNKIRHPDQLVAGGYAGSPTQHSLPQSRPVRHYAGSPMFTPKISLKEPSNDLEQSLLCRLMNGGYPCYSGWNFNWTPKIASKFKGWNTNFAKFNLDSHLNVGSFENDNFPVRGKLDVFKDYVAEVIRATSYEYYYNDRYSPAEALRRGSFNCWDGTQVILALARAFGISGGGIGHGTWGSDGHVWATIPGIGVIDPTALQRGYGFRSPKVKGYGGGNPSSNGGSGSTNNYNGDVNIHIHTDGNNVEVDDRKIDSETGRKIIDLLGINPSTGR